MNNLFLLKDFIPYTYIFIIYKYSHYKINSSIYNMRKYKKKKKEEKKKKAITDLYFG